MSEEGRKTELRDNEGEERNGYEKKRKEGSELVEVGGRRETEG